MVFVLVKEINGRPSSIGTFISMIIEVSVLAQEIDGFAH
uniref:Uncharacterized protein n=1 Tax=Rhizophora mucronata TaxID=61149 RepID=A0A2P2MXF1_RHIMU